MKAGLWQKNPLRMAVRWRNSVYWFRPRVAMSLMWMTSAKFERAKYVEVVNAPRSGFISQVHARIVGEASVALGAGRAKKGDPIDHAVGFLIHKKVGDKVEAGEPLFEIHANDEAKLADARKAYCRRMVLVMNLYRHYLCFTSKIVYSLANYLRIRHT